MENKIITVKNVKGEADTQATIIHENNIEYAPKISVIIPVYNTEKYLHQCLDSVVNQTLKELEIICVDDGSTDSSLEILKEYAQKDNRFTILTQKNLHAGVARNAGLTVAKGEYVHFLDSDDYLYSNVYKKLYNCLVDNNLDLIKFKAKIFDNATYENQSHNWTELKSEIFKDSFNKILSFGKDTSILANIPDTCWSGIYDKKFLQANHIYFNNQRVANDTSFFINCIINTKRMIILDEYVVHWRTNTGSSLMDNRVKYYNCQFNSFNLIYDLCKHLPWKQKNILLEIQFNSLMFFVSKWNEQLDGTKDYEQFKQDVTKFLYTIDPKFLSKPINKYWWFNTYKTFIPQKFKLFNFYIIKTFEKKKFVFVILGIKFTFTKKYKRGYKHYKNLNKKYYKKELRAWYNKVTSQTLNLDYPETYNEKIQWLKLYDSTPLKTRLADKYLVRDWVKEKIGEEYLIPLLGVWDKFDDIDFDKLPNQFVLKCNHGCGYNIIVKDKSKLDLKEAKNKINEWMKEDFAFKNGFELHYSAIPRKIIAEAYIKEVDTEAIDYKFICCDGIPYLCWVTNKHLEIHERSFYKLPEWELQDIELKDGGAVLDKVGVPKPENLSTMLEICKTLAKDFPFVRVDLYLVQDKILFGEMTFTSASGAALLYPDKWNYILGDKITLPNKKEGNV